MVGKKVIACSLLLGLVTVSFSAAKKTVVLKNGKSFIVKTSHGFPLPVSNDKVEIENGGPMVEPASETKLSKRPPTKEASSFVIFGYLKSTGKFKVTITSPVDDSIMTVTEADGPGKLWLQALEASECPAAWTWLDEPGETWFPINLKFENESTHETFEVLQWVVISELAKATHKKVVENIRSDSK